MLCALLSAMSIVLGKYMAINVGQFLRFSLENMPIIFAGASFGPVAGVIVGVISDLLGSVMVGYEINPVITVGAGVVGLFAGLYRYISVGGGALVRLGIVVAAAHIVGSVLIKTVGLSWFYDTHFIILLLWRLLNYVIVAIVEWLLLYKLLENKNIKAELNALRGDN